MERGRVIIQIGIGTENFPVRNSQKEAFYLNLLKEIGDLNPERLPGRLEPLLGIRRLFGLFCCSFGAI